MKKLLKPTRNERKLIEESGLDAREWLIERKSPAEMVLVHRTNETTKTLSL